jgi:hypothetical protein
VIHDPVQIRIGQLERLVKPVHKLDIRIAPHLAKDRCSLNRLVGKGIQFAEQDRSLDLSHSFLLVIYQC